MKEGAGTGPALSLPWLAALLTESLLRQRLIARARLKELMALERRSTERRARGGRGAALFSDGFLPRTAGLEPGTRCSVCSPVIGIICNTAQTCFISSSAFCLDRPHEAFLAWDLGRRCHGLLESQATCALLDCSEIFIWQLFLG